ncbi:hypothetical protein [Streptomyces sp. NBC_01233]|uniref:hypothetical protein n=1 Tax=Streptomyces sp. NBC_01233 TaxID=2903787 RepID=UPI002E127117|nr:hypothetical protein OG332_19650 [Streptomyces sp. NBC_01233]
MNRFFRNLLAVTTGVVAVSTLAAVPAQAQTINSGSCGAGYRQQDAFPLGDNMGASGAGVVFLYYNSSTGTNCAILRRDSRFKVTDGMGVSLKDSAGNSVADGQRAYTRFAGPVYLKAPGRCVQVYGQLTGIWLTENSSYLEKEHHGGSGWVHCG